MLCLIAKPVRNGLEERIGRVFSGPYDGDRGLSPYASGRSYLVLKALFRIYSLGLKKVIIETDAKAAVDSIFGSEKDVFEFGSIISCWKGLLRSGDNYSLTYVRRIANGMAYAFARQSHKGNSSANPCLAHLNPQP
ncbi:hypothetical protein PTKIN_Ptkin08bG0075600 [Pterospermum kingtungense]